MIKRKGDSGKYNTSPGLELGKKIKAQRGKKEPEKPWLERLPSRLMNNGKVFIAKCLAIPEYLVGNGKDFQQDELYFAIHKPSHIYMVYLPNEQYCYFTFENFHKHFEAALGQTNKWEAGELNMNYKLPSKL